MASTKSEHGSEITSPNSQETCLICSKAIKLKQSWSSNSTESEETLRNIAKILHVSSSVYDGTDFDSLPIPLLCSSCSVTILEAVKLQEAVTVLQDRLKKLTAEIKKDLVSSLDSKHLKTSHNSKEDLGQVERIRQLYAQCWTPCEIKLVHCTVPSKSTQDTSFESRELRLSLRSSIYQGQQQGTDEELDLDIQSDVSGHDDAATWEDCDPLDVNTISTNSVRCGNGVDPILEVIKVDIVECELCGKGFSTSSELRQHKSICCRKDALEDFKLMDTKKSYRHKPGKCHRCGRVFTRQTLLRGHLNRKVPCTQVLFNNAKGITEDQKTSNVVVNPVSFWDYKRRSPCRQKKCHRCGKIFNRPAILRKHLNRKVPCDQQSNDEKESDNPPINLADAGVDGGNRSDKSVSRSRDIPKKCNRCGKVFTRNYLLRNHLNRKVPCTEFQSNFLITNDSDFTKDSSKTSHKPKCHRCGKTFGKRDTFRLHLLRKTPCNQPSSNSNSVSSRYKSAKCHRCGKVFTRAYVLKVHLMKKIPCTVSSASNLKQDSTVGSTTEYSLRPTVNQCHRCGKIFTRSNLLRSHLRMIVPCTIPDGLKIEKANFVRNTRTRYKRAKCHRCGTVFSRTSILQKHLLKKIPCTPICNSGESSKVELLASGKSDFRNSLEISSSKNYHNPQGHSLKNQEDKLQLSSNIIFPEASTFSTDELCESRVQDHHELISDSQIIKADDDVAILFDGRDQVLTDEQNHEVSNDEQSHMITDEQQQIMPGQYRIILTDQSQPSFAHVIPYIQATSVPTFVTNSQTWNCRRCLKTFPDKSCLVAHNRTAHRRTYICRVCAETFATQLELRDHKRISHNMMTDTDLKGKRFQCQQCDRSYTRGNALKEHIIGMHQTGGAYQCKGCGKSFSAYQSLRRHGPCGLDNSEGLKATEATESHNFSKNPEPKQPSDMINQYSRNNSAVIVNKLPSMQISQISLLSTVPLLAAHSETQTQSTATTDYQLPEYEEPTFLSEVQSDMKIEVFEETRPWSSSDYQDGSIPRIVSSKSCQPEMRVTGAPENPDFITP
ncbi:unnamed protein product [Allacma fusca]|uniref:C2H2-type domain-containing protein n=1 Tax=Allacma fusca TaxID=39272 RepID=A0A8J2JJF8_9HEXA|nr:unnamed protein product [Allacma fusca]